MKEKKYLEISYCHIIGIIIVVISVFCFLFNSIPTYASTSDRPTSGSYLEYDGNYMPLQQYTYALFQNETTFCFAGTGNEYFTLTSTYPSAVTGHSDSLNGNRTTPSLNFITLVYASSIECLPANLQAYYRPISSCPLYHVSLTVDSNSIVTVGKNFGDRVSIVVKVPHGTNINEVVLDSSFTYTLPSNQYVSDLVTDIQGKLTNSRYKPIITDRYKKTWGQSYTTNYRTNITLFTEITEHEESEIYGDTYYYSIPIDILELGQNALQHSSLSNIVNYPNYRDALVTAGYISSMKFFVLTPTTQSVIKISDWNDNNDLLVSYQVDKINSDITNGDISQAQTQAYIDKRNEAIDDKLNEYVYNPNIEAGQNIVEKLNSIVNTVTGMIGTVSGVGAMFALFFTCLPTFVLDIISFTIISLCIISIYKALRG